jgi:4,5-DOPA dioxygenase extradiol
MSNNPLMPVLFVGHGSPTNAIEDNEFSRAWAAAAHALPAPTAILCVSAHWETPGVMVTSMAHPRTIHDFYGFPEELFAVSYPAPGSPRLAARIRDLLGGSTVSADLKWGLDHGAWSVLRRMYPDASVPIVQLSLDASRSPADHYGLAGGLAPLRSEGVLVVGSGNLVHNLRVIQWEGGAYDWASRFDAEVARRIVAADHEALVHYDRLGPDAAHSIPTNEHYLPLLYALALRQQGEPVAFFAEQVVMGSISMRSLRIG